MLECFAFLFFGAGASVDGEGAGGSPPARARLDIGAPISATKTVSVINLIANLLIVSPACDFRVCTKSCFDPTLWAKFRENSETMWSLGNVTESKLRLARPTGIGGHAGCG
jgi:hypothetical protein